MSHDLKSRMTSYYEAWSQQNVESVLEFFSEQSTFEDLAFAAKFSGLDQIRGFVELTYAGSPDFRVVPTQIIVSGQHAAAAWTMSGTHSGDFPGMPATGKRFEVRASSIVTFAEQQIATIVDYWNPVEFQRSVGLTG